MRCRSIAACVIVALSYKGKYPKYNNLVGGKIEYSQFVWQGWGYLPHVPVIAYSSLTT